ncbi:hypothetical protein [Paraburkholderia sp. J94]|uniref:hypothetical protein n=1 Tax=Paraburkholderia sp. J94 TaxID=2805441 RepID=UPI002AB1D64E|nr:hypothetical protein [Paraburkholderia sp. J94]
MLELTEMEWAALQAADERTFVSVVRNDIVRVEPALVDDPNLLDRLHVAYGRAKQLGFVHDKAIVEFLYLDASVPGFYQNPSIAGWLAKPGTTGEERFEMFLSVLRAKVRDRQENN